ncbi:MAG: hypothetical protein HY695_01750 [Deltaproteobacteria bacterium]|nr:hypothetical protein [Deltaproteobacteria bacterium]
MKTAFKISLFLFGLLAVGLEWPQDAPATVHYAIIAGSIAKAPRTSFTVEIASPDDVDVVVATYPGTPPLRTVAVVRVESGWGEFSSEVAREDVLVEITDAPATSPGHSQ